METQTVYKVLAEVDGKLESLTTLGTSLTYAEGQITYAPEDSMGIFVEPTVERAKSMGLGNKGYKRCRLVIHEATPLGNQMPLTTRTFGDLPRYPAILLGKEVWREEPVRPEPRFKVGDRVKGISSYAVGILKEPKLIIEIFWGPDRGLGGTPHKWLYKCEGGINYSDDMLELAPVEEWVDITGECTTRLTKGTDSVWLSLMYNGTEIGLFGVNGWKTWGESKGGTIRLESVNRAYPEAGDFKVLKLVKS